MRGALKSRQRGHGDYRLLMWIIFGWPYVLAGVVALVVWDLWRWFK